MQAESETDAVKKTLFIRRNSVTHLRIGEDFRLRWGLGSRDIRSPAYLIVAVDRLARFSSPSALAVTRDRALVGFARAGERAVVMRAQVSLAREAAELRLMVSVIAGDRPAGRGVEQLEGSGMRGHQASRRVRVNLPPGREEGSGVPVNL